MICRDYIIKNNLDIDGKLNLFLDKISDGSIFYPKYLIKNKIKPRKYDI